MSAFCREGALGIGTGADRVVFDKDQVLDMGAPLISRRRRMACRYPFWFGIGLALTSLVPLPADGAPPPGSREARLAEAYERDLRAVLQAQQKLSQALQTLLSQDQALRNQIMATATTAQRQMQAAEQMPDLRAEAVPQSDRDRRRNKDRDSEGPRMRVVDQSGAKASMAAGAMQLAAMLPLLNATLWRNNSALAKVASDCEANRQQFRSLADPFGRRTLAETERAIELMNDALLADPENEHARLVLSLAYVRRGYGALAEKHLSVLVESAGPWCDVALAARGHLRASGALGKDQATRRQGAAELNRAIALRSRQPEPFLFRALANWREGRWSQVEPDLQAAMRLRPDQLDGLRLMAAWYAASPYEDKKLAEAESAARRACELTTDGDPACLEALAAVQVRQGEWEAAIETQQKCVAVACGDWAVRAANRLTDYQNRKPLGKEPPFTVTDEVVPPPPPREQALAEKLETLRAPPPPGRAASWYADRGLTLALVGKWGPAAANYSRLNSLPPLREQGFVLGCLLWLSGDKAAFQELCQRVSASDASAGAVRLVSMTADSGLVPANVQRVATQLPSPPAGALHGAAVRGHSIALAHYRAGQTAEARKQVQQDLAIAPQLPGAGIWKQAGLGLHWQLLALIEAREGNIQPAKDAADRARLLLGANPPPAGDFGDDISLGIWLEYQILSSELQELLKGHP